MKLEWSIPVSIVIHGATEEELLHKTEFQYNKNINCEFSLKGKDPFYSPDIKETPYFMTVDHIQFHLVCLNDDIRKLIKSADYRSIIDILGKITNKVLKSIRVMGMAYYLHEVDYNFEKPQYYLYKWKVRYENRQEVWDDVLLIKDPRDLFLFSRGENKQSFVKGNKLKQIDTMVMGEESPPEREFIVNAMEYITTGNYRLAVIESIIGLEIALNGYLSTYFEKRHTYSKREVAEIIGPNLNLSIKVSALLNLALEKDVLKNVRINHVKKVIDWRNKIMHRTGHLNDVSENTIIEYLESVLFLVNILGFQQRKLFTDNLRESI